MRHTSQYDLDLAALRARMCNQCYGSGYVSDAAPGDMYCQQWICSTCCGTGFASPDTNPGRDVPSQTKPA